MIGCLTAGALAAVMLFRNNPNICTKLSEFKVPDIPKIPGFGSPSTISKHATPEIYINYTKLIQKDKYQLIFDITENNKRYTLCVLKDWRLPKLKPFVTQAEWNKMDYTQKRWYDQRSKKANGYTWYQLMNIDPDVYYIKSQAPIDYSEPIIKMTDTLHRKEMASIEERTTLVGDIDVIRKDQPKVKPIPGEAPKDLLAHTGPLVRAQAAPKGAMNKIRVIIPLKNLYGLKTIVHNNPGSTMALLRSVLFGGQKVNYYDILVPTFYLEKIYDEIVSAKIAAEVTKLGKVSIVRPPDFYRENLRQTNLGSFSWLG